MSSLLLEYSNYLELASPIFTFFISLEWFFSDIGEQRYLVFFLFQVVCFCISSFFKNKGIFLSSSPHTLYFFIFFLSFFSFPTYFFFFLELVLFCSFLFQNLALLRTSSIFVFSFLFQHSLCFGLLSFLKALPISVEFLKESLYLPKVIFFLISVL